MLAKERSHVLPGNFRVLMTSQKTKATFPIWELNTWLLNQGGALSGSVTNPAAQHASSPVKLGFLLCTQQMNLQLFVGFFLYLFFLTQIQETISSIYIWQHHLFLLWKFSYIQGRKQLSPSWLNRGRKEEDPRYTNWSHDQQRGPKRKYKRNVLHAL